MKKYDHFVYFCRRERSPSQGGTAGTTIASINLGSEIPLTMRRLGSAHPFHTRQQWRRAPSAGALRAVLPLDARFYHGDLFVDLPDRHACGGTHLRVEVDRPPPPL